MYKVIWHSEVKSDLCSITPNIVRKIVQSAEHRLSSTPYVIGQPLRGTSNRLWKIRFSKYRIVYTIREKEKEIQILSIQKRDIVYHDQHILNLLKLAMEIEGMK